MSALPTLQIARPTPSVSLQTHITVEEAGERLGVDGRHIRRLCTDKLFKSGLAVQVQVSEHGDRKPRWYIARRYDLRLAAGFAGEVHQLPDLSAYSDTQVKTAWQRAACVDALNDARRNWSGTQQTWLATLCRKLAETYPDLRISPTTLRGWQKVYRTASDLEQLVDKRGGNQVGEADPAAWEAFKRYYLDERQPSIKVCWERTRDDAKLNGWTWTSYKQAQRMLDRKIPPEMQAKYREPRKYRQAFSPFIEQDVNAWQANQCWVGDHTPLDLWCRSGEHVFRPTLTAWVDWRTRRVIGWMLSENPDASTITAALRKGIVEAVGKGPPLADWIDNGKDFDAYSLHGQTKKQRFLKRSSRVDETRIGGILQHLGIEAHWSLAHNPNGKSVIERWFGTLHDRFDKTFATHCGKDPQNKPESLNAFLREKPMQVPAFEHVLERLERYIAGYNASCESSSDYLLIDGVRLSPDQAMDHLCQNRRTLADPAAIDLLMQQWAKPIRVGRNGVTITPKGVPMKFGQFEPALVEFKGTDRLVNVCYDPDDLRSVRVFDDRWRFICEARSNFIGNAADPLKLADLKDALAEKKRYTRAKRQYAKGTHHEWQTTEEVAATNSAKKAATARKPQPDPSPMKIVQTPFDGQSNTTSTAKSVRKAAGAEHDAMPRQSFFAAFASQEQTQETDADAIQDARSSLSGWARFNTGHMEEVQ